MKNDANIRNFHGKSRKIREKSRKMHGKSGNFRGIHSSKWQNRREILRSFPVVFARNSLVIRSFLRSCAVVFGRFRGHSWIWFRFLSVFIPFHSFSFLNPMFLCSKT